MMQRNDAVENLSLLVEAAEPVVSGNDIQDIETLMDGTTGLSAYFSGEADPYNPRRLPTPEAILVQDVSATLHRALDSQGLSDVTNNDLLKLAGRIKQKKVVFYISQRAWCS